MAKKRKNITAKVVRASETKPYVPAIEAKPEIDADDCGDDGLTIKQRLFVAAITGPARGNATKAAEMAGYRSDNRHALEATASENLRKPEIVEAIAHAFAKKCAGPEWARASLIDLARSSMANFVSVDPDGEARIDFKKAAAAGALGQIKEYREEGIRSGDGDVSVVKRTIKIHDRTAALGMLLKLHGLLNEAADKPQDVEIKVRAVTRKPKPDADAGTD